MINFNNSIYILLEMSCRKYFIALVFIFFAKLSIAQYLKSGFDVEEFKEMIRINATYSESKKNRLTIPAPLYSTKVYASPIMGLENKWELWMTNNNVAVIGIRGSTRSADSWLANLFAVQIASRDTLVIADDFKFDYKLAENPRASIHAGYMFSTAFLIRDILPKIDSLYRYGIKDFIITGHSQGGGISYLLAADLLWRQRDGLLPKDIQFKVYTSASPKTGNVYFSYDYDRVVKEGWSYNIVSTEDWVPRSPFTVQTLDDLPEVNPVLSVEASMAKQSFFKRLLFRRLFKKVTKPPFKSVEAYHKYLGKYVGKKIKEDYKQFELPHFAHSNEYVNIGRQIVLYPDSAYFVKFNIAENKDNFMLHHSTNVYYYLLSNYNVITDK